MRQLFVICHSGILKSLSFLINFNMKQARRSLFIYRNIDLRLHFSSIRWGWCVGWPRELNTMNYVEIRDSLLQSLQKTDFKIGFNLFCSPKKLTEYKTMQPSDKQIWQKTQPFNLSSGLHDLFSLQDPNADTEWNDILRKKGILPPKEEPKEDEEEELALKQQSVGKTAVYRDSVLPKYRLCFTYLLMKFEKLSILLLLFVFFIWLVAFNQLTQLFLLQTVKTYEDMTLEELEENEDEFGEEDEAAIEMYR